MNSYKFKNTRKKQNLLISMLKSPFLYSSALLATTLVAFGLENNKKSPENTVDMYLQNMSKIEQNIQNAYELESYNLASIGRDQIGEQTYAVVTGYSQKYKESSEKQSMLYYQVTPSLYKLISHDQTDQTMGDHYKLLLILSELVTITQQKAAIFKESGLPDFKTLSASIKVLDIQTPVLDNKNNLVSFNISAVATQQDGSNKNVKVHETYKISVPLNEELINSPAQVFNYYLSDKASFEIISSQEIEQPTNNEDNSFERSL